MPSPFSRFGGAHNFHEEIMSSRGFLFSSPFFYGIILLFSPSVPLFWSLPGCLNPLGWNRGSNGVGSPHKYSSGSRGLRLATLLPSLSVVQITKISSARGEEKSYYESHDGRKSEFVAFFLLFNPLLVPFYHRSLSLSLRYKVTWKERKW